MVSGSLEIYSFLTLAMRDRNLVFRTEQMVPILAQISQYAVMRNSNICIHLSPSDLPPSLGPRESRIRELLILQFYAARAMGVCAVAPHSGSAEAHCDLWYGRAAANSAGVA